jgi:hypothetical protein
MCLEQNTWKSLNFRVTLPLDSLVLADLGIMVSPLKQFGHVFILFWWSTDWLGELGKLRTFQCVSRFPLGLRFSNYLVDFDCRNYTPHCVTRLLLNPRNILSCALYPEQVTLANSVSWRESNFVDIQVELLKECFAFAIKLPSFASAICRLKAKEIVQLQA